MRARIPKSYFSLPCEQQAALKRAAADSVYNIIDREYVKLQITWIKLAVITLHRSHKFGASRALAFLGNWKRVYAEFMRYDEESEQQAAIDDAMKEIFGVGGFPEEYFMKMGGIDHDPNDFIFGEKWRPTGRQ